MGTLTPSQSPLQNSLSLSSLPFCEGKRGRATSCFFLGKQTLSLIIMGNCGLSAPKTKGEDVAAKDVAPGELPKEESVKTADAVEAVETPAEAEKADADEAKPVDEKSLATLLTEPETEEKEAEKTEEEKKPEEEASEAKKEEVVVVEEAKTDTVVAEKAPEAEAAKTQ